MDTPFVDGIAPPGVGPGAGDGLGTATEAGPVVDGTTGVGVGDDGGVVDDEGGGEGDESSAGEGAGGEVWSGVSRAGQG